MSQLTKQESLIEAVRAVAPIFGVAFSGPTTVERIDFNGATAQQQTDANAVVAAFDWSDLAQDLRDAIALSKLLGRLKGDRVTSDRAFTSTGLADLADLIAQLAPNTHYWFFFEGAYVAAAGTTGLRLGVNGPANPAHISYVGKIWTSATAHAAVAREAYEQVDGPATSGGATALPFTLSGSISTGAAGGPFTLRVATEVNASAVTIKKGSYRLLAALN